MFCAYSHASAAIINYLDKYSREKAIFGLGDLYDLENDIEI